LKVAVTGATGFIGRHVVAELTRRGIDPILLCRSRTTAPPALSQYAIVECDLHASPLGLFEETGMPDCVIHLAWAGLPNYQSRHHFEEELPAQYRFLKSLVTQGLTHLVVTGTCFEYGMQSGSLHENLDANPANPYGFAKNQLRLQLEYLQKSVPFNFTWARLFYLYGDGQAVDSLLPQLKLAVERGDAAFNMSAGEQLRDYVSVTQAAEYLVGLALNRQNNGVVNVCSGSPISVRRLVERWIAENGWSISLNLGHYPYSDYEPMAFWGDRRKLDRCLAAQPSPATLGPA
jgi:dTDP-6-deoxy-L-talose 4-dehydrogenase (NAD+)